MTDVVIDGQVGPGIYADGSTPRIRQGKDGAQAVLNAHARYQEPVYRGGVYGVSTAAAGVALAAANASLTAATAQPIVGLLNPAGSGVIAVVLKALVGAQATGAAAVNEGVYVWQAAAPNASTTIAGTAPLNTKSLVTGGSKVIGSVNQAYTGNGQAWVQVKPFTGGFPRFAAPTASINVNGIAEELVDGLLLVPPGAALGLFTLAAGTTITAAGGLFWEEIPV